jgi:probable phosphoglycerate mutase
VPTRIIIARHGNTFTPEETPRRVGGRTDLPLVENERGTNIGRYLELKGYRPAVVFAAPLKRTRQTAELAVKALDGGIPLKIDESFREIDYGPDEDKTEEEVELRLGKAAFVKKGLDPAKFTDEDAAIKGREIINLWNTEAIVPNGWKVRPGQMVDAWLELGKKVEKNYKNKNVLVVSSNGIIRFAPYLTGDFKAFTKERDIKVTTGGVCVFEKNAGDPNWRCVEWNVKPKNFLQ